MVGVDAHMKVLPMHINLYRKNCVQCVYIVKAQYQRFPSKAMAGDDWAMYGLSYHNGRKHAHAHGQCENSIPSSKPNTLPLSHCVLNIKHVAFKSVFMTQQCMW